MVQKQLMSSASDTWLTPPEFLENIYKFSEIGLDPCSHPHSLVKSKNKILLPQDGLEVDWHKHEGMTFVNSPYGRKLKLWVKKAVVEHGRGAEVLFLLPARTDTKAFQKWIFPTASAICFIEGRIRFIDGRDPNAAKCGATFPSALVYWGPNVEKFEQVFSTLGKVVCF